MLLQKGCGPVHIAPYSYPLCSPHTSLLDAQGVETVGAWIVVFLALDFLWNFAWHLDMWILPFSPSVSCRVTLLAAELLPTSFGLSCFAMVCCTLTVSTCPTTESCLITIGFTM